MQIDDRQKKEFLQIKARIQSEDIVFWSMYITGVM